LCALRTFYSVRPVAFPLHGAAVAGCKSLEMNEGQLHQARWRNGTGNLHRRRNQLI
jgi:hypothetical protein